MDDAYRERSYGEVPIGFGDKLGVVVVDFQVGFTDVRYPLGGAPLIDHAVKNTARLLNVARSSGVPVANCNTAYMNAREMPYWKIRVVRETFLHDHPSTELDPRIYDPAYDLKICKTGASILFDTTVTAYFVKERVDTVIITGCVTSGCIRASVVDCFNNRFRTIVPEDCVGDYEEGPHRDNLRDIGRRYADIVTADDCIAFMEGWRN